MANLSDGCVPRDRITLHHLKIDVVFIRDWVKYIVMLASLRSTLRVAKYEINPVV
jgi:hypothetical protein